jgi:hypothetical protein
MAKHLTKQAAITVDPKEFYETLYPLLSEIREQLSSVNDNLLARQEFVDALTNGEHGVRQLLASWGDNTPAIANEVAEDFLALAYEARTICDTADELADKLCMLVR